MLLVYGIRFHPVFISLRSNTKWFTYAPLGCTVAFTALICLYYILGNFGHAQSQGGRQSAAAKPPWYLYRNNDPSKSAT